MTPAPGPGGAQPSAGRRGQKVQSAETGLIVLRALGLYRRQGLLPVAVEAATTAQDRQP